MIHPVVRVWVRVLAVLAMVVASVPALASQRPSAPAAGRATAQPEAPASVLNTETSADQKRDTLDRILDRYPPALGRVLKLDPSLLNDPGYLAPYPMLASFIAQHPEVVHNPGYFLEHINAGNDFYADPKWRERQEMLGLLAGVAAFIGFLIVTGVVVWIIRMIVTARRWNKVSKVQYEVHSKLLDRFTTNEDLLAYMQTAAGRRFLESAPISLPDEPRAIGAPFTRILWSIQAGIVLIMTGVGLLYVSSDFTNDEPAKFFMVIGVITLALGGGFIVSAIAAYGVSRKLGLLNPAPADHA